MKKLLFAIVFSVLLSPVSLFALNIEEAKAKGLVGEELTGYLGQIVVTPESSQLVSEINAKRREKYSQIATQNGTAVATVEALAGKKAIENTPNGEFIKSSSGAWVKK